MDKLNENVLIYSRQDGTSFMLRTSGIVKNNVIEHDYMSFDDVLGDRVLSMNKILSEDNLVTIPNGLRPGVANILLSRSRVKEKVNRFKGYVGYISLVNGRYQKSYSEENERRISGVVR